MTTLGGVIRGYCATGRNASAMAPVRAMTTDSTVAKIGRSMKKRAITGDLGSRQVNHGLRRTAPREWAEAGHVGDDPQITPRTQIRSQKTERAASCLVIFVLGVICG